MLFIDYPPSHSNVSGMHFPSVYATIPVVDVFGKVVFVKPSSKIDFSVRMDYPARTPNGRIHVAAQFTSHSQEAENRRSETQRQRHAAKRAWRSSDMPDWLNEKT